MNLAPGPGCIMHLKISGSFLQPFSTFRRIFSSAILDHRLGGGLLWIGNIKKAPENPS